jgi:hypothetical protein
MLKNLEKEVVLSLSYSSLVLSPYPAANLENEHITDKIKQDLRLGKVSINEAYATVELDQEYQSLYQKCLKAFEELKKSSAEIDNQPERTK